MADWARYLLLVTSTTNGPTRVEAIDDLGEDEGKRDIVEVVLSVYVDVHCRRCDCTFAALPPEDIDLGDVARILDEHEPSCVPAPTWAREAGDA